MAKLLLGKIFWQAYNRGLYYSLLELLFFQININDLPDGIPSCKIFADDTLLFPKVNDKNNCNAQLNSDLEIIIKWAFWWKISFNPAANKQAIEVCFSNRRKKKDYTPLIFISKNVQSAASQKCLKSFHRFQT